MKTRGVKKALMRFNLVTKNYLVIDSYNNLILAPDMVEKRQY
jgi:hypothetical protein